MLNYELLNAIREHRYGAMNEDGTRKDADARVEERVGVYVERNEIMIDQVVVGKPVASEVSKSATTRRRETQRQQRQLEEQSIAKARRQQLAMHDVVHQARHRLPNCRQRHHPQTLPQRAYDLIDALQILREKCKK